MRGREAAGAKTFKKAAGTTCRILPKMKTTTLRDTSRPRLSLRYGAIHAQAITGTAPAAAQLPTHELRRLVERMVD